MPSPIDLTSPSDGAGLAATHTPERIRQRLQARATHSYLRDFVYGAIDGTVTTFAVVSGVAGAGLSTSVILILGIANLVGDGFSMAAIMTLAAFVVVGLIPLVPFIYDFVIPTGLSHPYLASTIMTGIAFFLVGTAKSWFVDESWFRAGVETLIIGGGAASLAYVVGLLLGNIVD